MTATNMNSSIHSESQHHIRFLDGIRGFAALYVVLHHVWLETALCMSAKLHHGLAFLSQGRFAVSVFIVLSGYVLMMPLAESQDGRLRKGLKYFFFRRSRRILPPYYAALLVSMALIQLAKRLNLTSTPTEIMSIGTVASHVLLIHNLSPSWYQSIDPPLWTVATEWQIYFVFALVLVPLWQRCKTVITTICAFGLGLSPFLLAKLHLPTFFWASPWFLGLFGFGMFASCAEWSERPEDKKLRLPWLAISTAAFIVYLVICNVKPAWADHHEWPMDTLAGLSAVGLMGHFARIAHQRREAPWLMRVFQSRLAIWLAGFSYSLYLIHLPVLSFVDRLLNAHMKGFWLAVAIWCVSMPLSIIAGRLMYFGIEQRFKSKQT